MTNLRAWIAAFVGLAILVAVPLTGGAYLTTFAFVMLVAFILAQSWDWVGGEAGYINLAHYAFFGIGAYAFSLLLVVGYPLPVCFAFSVVFTAAVAFLASFPLFRLHGDYFAFGTLALMPLAEVLAFNLTPITRGADGVVLPAKYVLYEAYWIALGVCVVTLATTIRLNKLPFGYALKGIRNDEQAAEIVGIRIFPAKAKVLCLSAGFAGIAGAVQAWQLSYIDPPSVFGLDVGLVPIAMALLGGSGLLWGPLVGVIILSVVQQVLVVNLTILQATIYGALILLIGRYMPGGLLRSALIKGNRRLAFLGREHHERVAVAPGAAVGGATDGAPQLPIASRPVDRTRTLLSCRNLTKSFGGNVAVDSVDLDIKEGEIVGLVGTNGSGKTTLFNCISKVYEPTGGEVVFAGRSLVGRRRDEASRLGIGRTYQIPRPFSDLTVLENIAIPLMYRDEGSLALAEAMAQARAFAAYAGLEAQMATRADGLNLQQKKALEFARALACRPRLLLVDEVASGLTPAEVRQFVGHIREIRDRYGVTVIWVEHIFSALAQVVDRVVVLEQGRIIADGTLAEVVKDEKVLKTYLGSAARDVAPARPGPSMHEAG